MVKVVRKLIICADSPEAKNLFRELASLPGNKGYTNRLEAVVPIGDSAVVEAHLFKTLRQLDSLDGMRFEEVTITDNAYRNRNQDSLNKAIYLKSMLTLHVPKEETL